MDESASAREMETQRVVETLAHEACVSLFDAYGVTLVSHEELEPHCGVNSLTGIIGFTGNGITGMCLVASSEEPLQASNPGGALRDWVAELSNQLAGRLKHKLLAAGVEVYITTPIVLRATRIEPLPRRKLSPSCFRNANGGLVTLWVEVEITADFEFKPSSVEVAIAEGETMMF